MPVHVQATATKLSPIWHKSPNRTLTVLAPAHQQMSNAFSETTTDSNRYYELIAGMQRLRGRVYLRDGAIRPSELTQDARHVSSIDEDSWHILAVDQEGLVCGCARYTSYPDTASYSNLCVRKAALAGHPEWRENVRRAVEREMGIASRKGVSFVEVGGWALDGSARCTSEAVRIALSAYALSRNLGGCVGLTTATVRHDSATILQKIGGSVLSFQGTPLPLYYDPQYQCEMTILRFDSSEPNPRYEPWIQALSEELKTVPVILRSSPPAWRRATSAFTACA